MRCVVHFRVRMERLDGVENESVGIPYKYDNESDNSSKQDRNYSGQESEQLRDKEKDYESGLCSLYSEDNESGDSLLDGVDKDMDDFSLLNYELNDSEEGEDSGSGDVSGDGNGDEM